MQFRSVRLNSLLIDQIRLDGGELLAKPCYIALVQVASTVFALTEYCIKKSGSLSNSSWTFSESVVKQKSR